MDKKLCSKCGEMVHEAKAFCPGCGNAIVEEKKRVAVPQFDQLDHTVRLGDTMYNQMLSEMGLNASKQASRGDKDLDPPMRIATEPGPLPEGGPSFAMIAVIAIAVLTAAAIVLAFLYSR